MTEQVKWSNKGDAISPEILAKRLISVTQELRAKGNNGNLLAQALFQTAKIAEQKAIQLVPTKTGRLKKAIKKRRDRNPHLEGATENYQVFVKKGRKREDLTGAYYWTWVHFGSIRHKGVPFLTNAFEETKTTMAEEFKSQLFKKIELAEKRVKKIK